jgi:rhamnosyltransferase
MKALWWCTQQGDAGDVIYLLGYGIGPLLWIPLLRMRQKRIRFWINPDGLEWKRSRWSTPVQWYLWLAERIVVKQADRVVADAVAIKDYLQDQYHLPNNRFSVIEYGAPQVDQEDDRDVEAEVNAFLNEHDLEPSRYFMKVARCVPENNLHLLVRAFTSEDIDRKLLIITDRDADNSYYQDLLEVVDRNRCANRIKIRGPIYDQSFLKQLRRQAYGYLHGHSVGGTNPSLVEAMGEESFILALDTVFNREVLEDAALYFKDDVEDVVTAVREGEELTSDAIEVLQSKASSRVQERYNWARISECYADLIGDSHEYRRRREM